MQSTIISILGRPLSGKDTQAELLLKTIPNAIRISTGDIIREVKKEGSSHRFWPVLGDQIETMESGVLVSEEAMNTVFEEVVDEKLAEGVTTIIATAHPRTLAELDSFDNMVKREGLKPVFVNLATSEEFMYAMRSTRDSGRADDGEQVLATRAREFADRTKPVIDRLRNEGRLVEIDAERPREVVQSELRDSLRPYVSDPEITLPAAARR